MPTCSICKGYMENSRGTIKSTYDNEIVGYLCGQCYSKLKSSEVNARAKRTGFIDEG